MFRATFVWAKKQVGSEFQSKLQETLHMSGPSKTHLGIFSFLYSGVKILMWALEKGVDIWREFESKQTSQQSTLTITHRRPQISVSGDHLRLVDIENRWKRNLWICFRCCEQSSPGGKSGLNCGESSMGGTTTTTRDQQESMEGTSTMATTKIPENAEQASSRCS